jgi:hypothetical protein
MCISAVTEGGSGIITSVDCGRGEWLEFTGNCLKLSASASLFSFTFAITGLDSFFLNILANAEGLLTTLCLYTSVTDCFFG